MKSLRFIGEQVSKWRNFIALTIALLVAWQFLPWALRIPAYILPPLSAVYGVFDSKLWFLLVQTLPTLYEIVLGFVLAVAIGIALGMMIGLSKLVRETVYPLLIVVNSVPKIALAPLIIVWLGFGMLSIVTIIFLLSFFPVLINTMVGVMNVEPELIELVQTMTRSTAKEFLRVRLPASVPYIFAGMRTSATLTAVGAVIAEFIVGQSGLGFTILSAQQNLDVALIFACLTLLIVVTLGIFGLIIVAERVMMPWRKNFEII